MIIRTLKHELKPSNYRIWIHEMTYCRKCKSDGIKKQAKYGPEGGKPTQCSKHGKKIGYVDVASKRCEDAECKEFATYGVDGTKMKTHCTKHGQKLGLIDVTNKRCEHPGCKTCATFGEEGTTVRTHCSTHGKSIGLVNVMSKRCEHDGCKTIATFGKEGTKVRTHCSTHGKDLGLVDVSHERCNHAECKEFATYGEEGSTVRTHCPTHGKSIGLVDVSNKKCEHLGCITQAKYGIVKNRPTHCVDHKDAKMSNVINNKCKSCTLTQVRRKGDYCAVCDEFEKNDGASRLTRSKERAVIHALLENDIPNVDYVRVYDVQYNKSIGKACGGYRPDILIDCGNFMIIIEVDEFQHRPRYVTNITREIDDDGIERLAKRARVVSNYEGSCEMTRMINIRFAAGVPCYVIRFNPDAFKINGVPGRVSIGERHAELCRQVKSMMTKPPRSDLVVTYMYYNDVILATEEVSLPPGYVWDI